MLAGPFGRGPLPDRRRSFGAGAARGLAPLVAPEAARGSSPHMLKTEQHRCYAGSTEDVGEGVFYAQTFFTIARAGADVLVAVQGALAVWVDDTLVLARDLRQWGVWQKFGTVVRVGAGRHRVLARLMADGSSVRLLTPDGRPADVTSDTDDGRGYSITPPRVLGRPEPHRRARRRRRRAAGSAKSLGSARSWRPTSAHVEGLDDVADVLVGPARGAGRRRGRRPRDRRAVRRPAIRPCAADVQQRTEKDLRTRAVAADPRLWASRGWLILDQAKQAGLAEGVAPFRKLAAEFPDVPEVLGSRRSSTASSAGAPSGCAP